VARFPSLVFLCGGEVSDSGDTFRSCRDIFVDHVASNGYTFKDNIVLAEKVFTYFEHSAYDDLFHFEKDLAELSLLTVILSESPGSIAELGSFSALPIIQDKLLVVMHSDDSEKESFIWRGPISHLRHRATQNDQGDPIAIYNWQRRTDDPVSMRSEDFADARDLAEYISELLEAAHKTSEFRSSDVGHIMLFMIDLLRVVSIANLAEIEQMMNFVNLAHGRKQIEQWLSLLVSLGYIKRHSYRNTKYFLPGSGGSWLSIGFRSQAQIRDIDRWQSRFVEYYEIEEVPKARALKALFQRNSGKEMETHP